MVLMWWYGILPTGPRPRQMRDWPWRMGSLARSASGPLTSPPRRTVVCGRQGLGNRWPSLFSLSPPCLGWAGVFRLWTLFFLKKFFFSLFFRLDNFYWSTSNFTDSFLCLLHDWASPVNFLFQTLFLSSKMSFWFYNLHFSAKTPIFSFISNHFHAFKCIYFDHREHSYSRYFKVFVW